MGENAKVLAKLLPNGYLTLKDLYNYYGGEVALDKVLGKLNPGYTQLGFPAFWVKKDGSKLILKVYGTTLDIPKVFEGLIYKADLTKIKITSSKKIESSLEEVSISNPVDDGGIIVVSIAQEAWELDYETLTSYKSFKEAFLAEGLNSQPMFLSYKLFELLYNHLNHKEIRVSPMAKEIVENYGNLFKLWCEQNSLANKKAA